MCRKTVCVCVLSVLMREDECICLCVLCLRVCVCLCELVCVPVGMCNCTDLCGVWACEPICVCVSEDSIWTVPSLPVGRGTTWLSVNHRLTYDLLGSHRHKDTHTHEPRYLHIRRYTSTLSRPAVLTDWLSHTETGRRDEVRVTVRLDCFLRLWEWVWNSLRLF